MKRFGIPERRFPYRFDVAAKTHHNIPPEPAPSGGAKPIAADEALGQLERVGSDLIFRKSDSLRSILAFLVNGLIESPGASFKEHEIATRALGRPEDFDPRLDSTVRVHTARLRTKLMEYYNGAGRCDPIIFEIPKGAYQLTARRNPAPPPPPGEAILPRLQRWLPVAWACAATVAALVLAILLWRGGRPAAPEALRTLWWDFSGPAEPTTLVFSNTRFIPAPDGLHYVPSDGALVAPEMVIEHYTGTGDVYGISALSTLFAQYWRPVRLKRGRLLTWDDARQQNLVFIGGPNVNLQLGQLPDAQRFRFVHSVIEDVQARSTPPPRYGNSGRPYKFDHAVISLIRFGAGRSMMTLAGTSTLGTQAAVDFVTREDTAKRLLATLGSPRPGSLAPFEALLKTTVTDGVPVQSQILAVHMRK